MLLLVAAVQSNMAERHYENAILRTMGAPRRLILGAAAIEFGLMGFIAGTLATFIAELLNAYVSVQLMEMSFQWHPLLWVIGPLVGTVAVSITGILSSYPAITRAPAAILVRG